MPAAKTTGTSRANITSRRGTATTNAIGATASAASAFAKAPALIKAKTIAATRADTSTHVHGSIAALLQLHTP